MPVTLPLTTYDTFIEEVWSGVSEKTRVLFLSHITSPTGLTFPLGELIITGYQLYIEECL